jgi:hypothetical protein
VSRDIGQLLIDAIHGAPITAAYFSQVAAAMIQADQARFGGHGSLGPSLNLAVFERQPSRVSNR